MWPGNREFFLGINIFPSICIIAGTQTIWRDRNFRVGVVPSIPVGVANSLGLNSIDSLYILFPKEVTVFYALLYMKFSPKQMLIVNWSKHVILMKFFHFFSILKMNKNQL
jgi:hypothetical protein